MDITGLDPKFMDGNPDRNRRPEDYLYVDKGIDPKKAHMVKIDLVKRADWGAVEPLQPPVAIKFPRVVLWYYDIGVNPCHNAEECVHRVREIQQQHLDMGLPDIAYNFLIGGDGRVYEGRGYTNNPSKLGDKYAKYEGKSFDVAYIGRFTEDKPAYPDMRQAGFNLLQNAVLDQHIDLFFLFVEDVKPSEFCTTSCPYPAPDPEPGDPVVDFMGLGI